MINDLVLKHAATLQAAMDANRLRTFHAHWPEAPSGKIYGETANADGEARFRTQCGTPFQRLLQEGTSMVGAERSPYGFDLGLTYPASEVSTLVDRAAAAQVTWQALSPDARASVLVESLERAAADFFEIGYATMHTTGQGFVMAFQASGPHAFDRGLEAVAMGLAAQQAFVSDVQWTKPMGRVSVTIDKHYRLVPRGINLVIGCSTFPVWNTLPGMFAGLVTGNSVIVKPHPGAIYPIALVVAAVQRTLADIGLDPHLVQLAPDTTEQPVTLTLVDHPAVTVIDYTGGPTFGAEIERRAAGKTLFMEKAGVNCVILESVENMEQALDNVAFSLSLYAGQMCTAPQNIFVPKGGILAGGERVSVDTVVAMLRERLDTLVGNEKMGPGTLGAIQNPATAARVAEAAALGLDVVRPSTDIRQPGFDGARSVSPLVLRTTRDRADIFEREWFGPISFVIEVDSFNDAVDHVVRSVRSHGALTTLVYTTDEAQMNQAEDAIVAAGAPVAFNLNSFVWVNQSAAFSDFHGTGANPAGNAAYADWSFVTNRYHIIGVRRQA